MDEEAVRRDFEVYAAMRHLSLRGLETPGEYEFPDTKEAWLAWLESARRADRKARIECVEICRDVHKNYECSRIGADLCKHAIRATIKEEST